MNKQPFYHRGFILNTGKFLNGDQLIDTVRRTRGVLKDTVELVPDADVFDAYELLFTATKDVSDIVNRKLKDQGVSLSELVDAEAGDPADLMG